MLGLQLIQKDRSTMIYKKRHSQKSAGQFKQLESISSKQFETPQANCVITLYKRALRAVTTNIWVQSLRPALLAPLLFR
jgi:hypothetical protein